jgi:hypothetical protein
MAHPPQISEWLSLYYWCRDQGSLVAGAMALVAGVIAYVGAVHGAKDQAAATNEQTAALRQQNEALKESQRRTLARDGLVAIRMLNSVIDQMQGDIDRVTELLDQPAYSGMNAAAPGSWKTLIQKPPLSVVWITLGNCGREVIDKYLMLDSKIDQFAKDGVHGAQYMRDKLNEFSEIAHFVSAELESDAQKCNAVLAGSQH